MAYQTGQDGKPLLSGEYLAAVGRGEIQDDRVGGFTPGPTTYLGRNDQGLLVTNAMRVGKGSAAKKTATGVIASAPPAPAFGGVQNTPTPATAPPKPPANTAPASAGNWGGVQNTPSGQNPAATPAAPAAPTPSGGKLGDLNTMQQHWNQYWSNFAAGSKVPFAGGELTRNADGSATFKSAAGQSYTYTKDTPFSDLASRFPEIAAVWKQDFGYGAAPAPGSAPGQPPGATPGQPPAGPGATQTEVTPEMSVEERAAAIAATDSPLMQQARGRAMQQMNERGLINSSLGIQAGQEAVLDRATDIAKADAQTEFQNSQNNANRNLNWQTAQLQAQTSLQNAQLSAQTQLSVAEINRQYSQMANLSSTSASLLTAYNNDVNSIVLSDLPAEAKEAAINARTQTLRMSMNVMGSINGDVDMNTLLNQILG